MLGATALALCSRGSGGRPAAQLVVFAASSLGAAFGELAERFERAHPGVRVQLECGGSLWLVRRLLELGARCDVLALADAELFEEIQGLRARTDEPQRFARDRLVLAFREGAPGVELVRAGRWYDALLAPGVRFGRADERAAPVGYRTLLCWRLAEAHYGLAGLAARLEQACPPARVRSSLGALSALLVAGELDYAFTYGAAARAAGLAVQGLPREIDFSEPALAERYGAVSLELGGGGPGSGLWLRGSPVRYAMACVRASGEPELAGRWCALVLGAEGQAVLARHGLLPP